MTHDWEDKGNHQIIRPPHDLKKKAKPLKGNAQMEDPIAKAEQALQKLSANFSIWIEDEVAHLVEKWGAAKDDSLSKDSLDTLFRAAIDIKGQAETFGYPIAGFIADSLCRLIEHGQAGHSMPYQLVDQHVQAIRAVVQEGAKGEESTIALTLLKSLKDVTEDYLEKSA